MFYSCSMTGAVPSSLQLDELTQMAYRLGKAFGQAAEQAETHERRLELFGAFDRAFFSVRVGIALQLRLRREAAAPLPTAVERETEREVERAEPLERDPAERVERYDERDRDRDAERASFPVLLRTLEGVADAASLLPGPPPAELPTLRELLAQVAPKPQPAPVTARPQSALRARLAGSGASVTLTAPPALRAPPGALARRRATGPPG